MELLKGLMLHKDLIIVDETDDLVCPIGTRDISEYFPDIVDIITDYEIAVPHCSHCWNSKSNTKCPFFVSAITYGEIERPTEYKTGGTIMYITCLAITLAEEDIAIRLRELKMPNHVEA